jgi:hypothetical protein
MNYNMHPMKTIAVDAHHYSSIVWKFLLKGNASYLVDLDIDWKYLFEKSAFCLPCIHGFGAMISMVAGYFS